MNGAFEDLGGRGVRDDWCRVGYRWDVRHAGNTLLNTRAKGDREVFISELAVGRLLMFAYERLTTAHDDDGNPGSLGALTATHLQQLGRDRTPARPPIRGA